MSQLGPRIQELAAEALASDLGERLYESELQAGTLALTSETREDAFERGRAVIEAPDGGRGMAGGIFEDLDEATREQLSDEARERAARYCFAAALRLGIVARGRQILELDDLDGDSVALVAVAISVGEAG